VANTKSAQKAMRQAERRAVRNQAARSAVRTYVKKAAAAVGSRVQGATDVVREAVSALDVAAQKGIVHRNAAARRKSRLMSRLHQLTVAQAQPAEPEAKTKAPSRRGAAAAARAASAGEKKPATRRATTTTRRAPKE
jgi:small subunit ribosomal protein S20